MASGSFPVQADPTDPEAELEGSSTPRPAVGADAASLVARYVQVRDFTRQLAAPLSAEDCVVQSMPDASPTKWHLAHVTWFFETFVLKPQAQRGFDYRVFDPDFEYLFNSYYNSVGAQYPRGQRGLITRPDLATVLAYREHVDQALARLIEGEPV